MARVTISSPIAILEAADKKLADEDESRSGMLRRLIEAALKEAEERADVEWYIRAYREQPQTEEEFGWSDVAALEAFVELPWE
jgi:metal-responsive CopG/Arc/MetJ family transcriptional regulator